MPDKNTCFMTVEHTKGSEKSELKAFKIDDVDGIAERIGFKSNMVSKVDYFLEKNSHVQLIELSDLTNEVSQYLRITGNAYEKLNQEKIKGKEKREKFKEIENETWRPLKDEFCKKWNGSIAVIERLYRKSHQFEDDIKYKTCCFEIII